MDAIPITLGIPGRYTFWGVPVQVIDHGTPLILKIALTILGQYTHVFQHEMGHALAHRAFTGRTARVFLFADGDGHVMFDRWRNVYPQLSNLQKIMRSFAGPFSTSSYCVLSMFCVSRFELWLHKYQKGKIGVFQNALFTILKVQAIVGVLGTWLQTASLFMDYSMNTDFQDIYLHGGMSASIISAGVVTVFGVASILMARRMSPKKHWSTLNFLEAT